jgi:hypothetical protein
MTAESESKRKIAALLSPLHPAPVRSPGNPRPTVRTTLLIGSELDSSNRSNDVSLAPKNASSVERRGDNAVAARPTRSGEGYRVPARQSK